MVIDDDEWRDGKTLNFIERVRKDADFLRRLAELIEPKSPKTKAAEDDQNKL